MNNWGPEMKHCLSCEKPFDSAEWNCPICGFTPELHDGHYCFTPYLARQNDGFSAESFELLFKLESQNFWFRSRNKLIIWAIRNYFPEMRNMLEIGCGTGFVLAGIRYSFPHIAICGSEIHAAGLAFAARRLPDVNLFQMDARRIPFRSEFDLIGAFDVLEHIEEDERVLDQIFQALTPKGGVIITVPQHQFLWSAADEFSYHKRRYSRKELVEKVSRAGFSVIRITSFVSLLLPLMFLARRKKRKLSGAFDPTAEFRIGPLANIILEGIMDVERLLIKCRLPVPAGGSLLLVARKGA
jgi:SAM-dependent methyltransferase